MHGLPREFICHLKPLESRKKYKKSLKRKLEDYYSCDVIYALLFFLSFHSFCLKSASKRRGMTVMRRHSRFIHARSSIYRLFSSTIPLKGHPPQVALLYSVDLAQTPYAGGAKDRWAGSLRVVHFALFSHGHSPTRFNYNTREAAPTTLHLNDQPPIRALLPRQAANYREEEALLSIRNFSFPFSREWEGAMCLDNQKKMNGLAIERPKGSREEPPTKTNFCMKDSVKE